MLRNMLLSAVLLGLFAVFGTGLVAFTYSNTAAQIAENERQALLRNLHVLVPPTAHDNDLYTDRITVTDPLLGTGKPVEVYRARDKGRPVAAILAPVAPDGYAGDIRLLVAVNWDGRLAGVRVQSHSETPGLGDPIDAERSDWILQFAGLSLANPPEARWKVKKDGGNFDQFTGATITPRAVVGTVRNTLHYFQLHRDALFARDETGATTTQEGPHG